MPRGRNATQSRKASPSLSLSLPFSFTPILCALLDQTLTPKRNRAMALLAPLLLFLALALPAWTALAEGGRRIPTTLDGPFVPVTVPIYGRVTPRNAVDLPDSDPRVQRRVTGWEPEQISLSLSATEDSVWISWITGLCSVLLYGLGL